ncbi:MAG: helix-turn-helix domain-containing protein [Planctomycetia bacterium]|nr:helix-turn-helix domain-containing protein [Planctomycetia bacterium]
MTADFPQAERLLLTPDEAAATCGLCPKTLRLAVLRGELRAVQIGRRCVRFSPQDLRAWIETLKAQGVKA